MKLLSWLRALIFNLIFALGCVGLSLVGFLSYPFVRKACYWWTGLYSRCVSFFLWVVYGVRVKVEGQENLPQTNYVVLWLILKSSIPNVERSPSLSC